MGPLAQRLREDRALSQEHLAALAHISIATVQRLERGEKIRRANAVALLRALHKSRPVSAADQSAFRNALGMDNFGELPPQGTREGGRSTDVLAVSLTAFTAQLPGDEARCYQLLADLIDTSGVTATLNLLDTVAKFARLTVKPLPREIVEHSHEPPMLGTPPRQRADGSIEQVFVPATGARTTTPHESTRVTKAQTPAKPHDSSKRKHA